MNEIRACLYVNACEPIKRKILERQEAEGIVEGKCFSVGKGGKIYLIRERLTFDGSVTEEKLKYLSTNTDRG